jgi:hypothetical protein
MKGNELGKATEQLKYFNLFHDASLTKIVFSKRRDIDEKDGSLVYPFEDTERIRFCDIKACFLHNNYDDARPRQVVELYFKDVRSFEFNQNDLFDYSDIYQIECVSENDSLKFTFYCTSDKIAALKIICDRFKCKEK